MTEEAVSNCCELIAYVIRRYNWHRDWEDLEGYCRLRVWSVLQTLPAETSISDRLVAFVTRHAAAEWLRGPQNALRCATRDGVAIPVVISSDDPASAPHLRAVEPDFAPRLIHQLWCRGVWDLAERLLPPRQWMALRYKAMGGIYTELAAQEGCDPGVYEQLTVRARRKLRAALAEESA